MAHPDDEYYFAATVYRIAQELGGIVDQVVITNGEGGFRYSQLAERYYGATLHSESAGRSRLPAIRKEETRRAGQILGIRRHWFLDERDHRFTLDSDETLGQVWNCKRIADFLDKTLRAEDYDCVFVVLPRAETHGHHQAASLLALEAVQRLDPARRPAVLGAEPGRQDAPLEPYTGHHNNPLARTESPVPAYSFDRRRPITQDGAMHYEIVVNWVIAEHKSQGMFQNDNGRHDCERFWLFRGAPAPARQSADALFSALPGR